LIPDLKKVCCEIHSFRAEPENDSRHLTEFPLIEFEFAYSGNGFVQLLDNIEKTVKSMVDNVLKDSTLDHLIDRKRLFNDIQDDFVRIEYTDAIQLLNDKQYCIRFGADLKHGHEMAIAGHFNKPTFIMHYPEKIKFFNMRRDRDSPKVVESADLIMPYSGESVGSAVREEDHSLLVEKLKNSEMYKLHLRNKGSFEDFRWYLDSIKDNPVPHAGCGIGLSRITQYVLGERDIRKCSAYPMNCSTDLNKM